MSGIGRPYDRYAPDIIDVAVAEILACCDEDPARRQAHRRRKLLEYPAELREEIREKVNQRILARKKSPEPLRLYGDPRTSAAKEEFLRQGRAKYGD